MTKNRLEAFSDGVLAIIITIMVLELKVPHDTSWSSLYHILPVFFSYVFSFLMVAIYWGNHHHLLHTIHHINSRIMWANTHLLFWLSLVPFATAWMGENSFARNSMILYAVLLNCCGVAYYILLMSIRAAHHNNQKMLSMLKNQRRKGMISVVLYFIAIVFAYLSPIIAGVIFILVAISWLMPDKQIEKMGIEQG